MKKVLRLIFKILLTPVVFPVLVVLYLMGFFFMFYAWLNDKEWGTIDKAVHQDFKQDMINWFTKV